MVEFRNPLKQEVMRSRSPMTQPLIIRTTADNGICWIGTFEGWDEWGMRAVFAYPDPEMLLVIAGAVGYLLDVGAPKAYVGLPVLPIRNVERAQGADILVGADYTRLFAVDRKGLRWVSERLCLDLLQIVAANQDEVSATGIFAASGPEQPFAVDMNTGRMRTGPVHR